MPLPLKFWKGVLGLVAEVFGQILLETFFGDDEPVRKRKRR